MDPDVVQSFIEELEADLLEPSETTPALVGVGALPSVFATTDLAAAAVAVAGGAVARLIRESGHPEPGVQVDAVLASRWFAASLVPDGWTPPPVWDAVAGDYATADGWIRLHTNAAHHRAAALSVLGCAPEREAVATAVAEVDADELEGAVVAAGGCAAAMRSEAAWRAHDQGRAVAAEPVLHHTVAGEGPRRDARPPERPLAGVRVLDLTRVLAGPVATRLLAGLGADVVRVDPPEWDEATIVPEVTRGKRCVRLDLSRHDELDQLLSLLDGADILVHGYRPGALEGLGLGREVRDRRAPGLVDVALDAYGWTGPWAGRRGFDSLVQMSSGIAHTGMVRTGAEGPTPLPVQALDHATGHLLAAAALHGWADRVGDGVGSTWRTSLARVASVLAAGPRTDVDTSIPRLESGQIEPSLEDTPWGPARRVRPPLEVDGTPLHWDRPSSPLGSTPRPVAWWS